MAKRRLTRFLILRSCAEYWLRVVPECTAASTVTQPQILVNTLRECRQIAYEVEEQEARAWWRRLSEGGRGGRADRWVDKRALHAFAHL